MKQYSFCDQFVDPALEQGLLAAIVKDSGLYARLQALLPAGAFAAEAEVWHEISGDIESGHDLIAGQGWTPTRDPEGDAKKLVDLFQRRQIAGVVQELAHRLQENELPAKDLAEFLTEKTGKIRASTHEGGTDRLRWGRDLACGVLDLAADRLEKRQRTGKPVMGLATGITKLDEILNGLNPGLYIKAGAPGAGKTTGALQIGIHVAGQGTPCLYVTYENSPENLILKALCAGAQICPTDVERGFGDVDQLSNALTDLRDALSRFAVLEATSKLTTDDIRAGALQLMNRCESTSCLIIVDYLQRAAHAQGYDELRNRVSAVAADLRDVAMELKSPVLAISSQNRVGGNYGTGKDGDKKCGSVSLDSLKESGDLEYAADVVMFLTHDTGRTCMSSARPVNLTVAKNRFGATDQVQLVFRPDIGVLREGAK